MDRFLVEDDDGTNELESVPLPIQTFLWRQTKLVFSLIYLS